MKIILLTAPDCAACEKLGKLLRELKVTFETIDIIQHPELLATYHLFAAPGLVIDGKLEFTGLPSRSELKNRLSKQHSNRSNQTP